jgi:hypothetical protein
MAWPIILDKFLWLTSLFYGVAIYGGVLGCLAGVQFFDFNMKWHTYVFWALGMIPFPTAVLSIGI